MAEYDKPMPAFAATWIELEDDVPAPSETAESAQQLVTVHRDWIAGDGGPVKRG